MNEQEKLALSGLGLALLYGAAFCAFSTLELISITGDMATSEGPAQVAGYIVATGIASVLAVPTVLLLGAFGTLLTVCPWNGRLA